MVLEFNWIILELHKSGKGKCVECKLIQQKCQIISGRYQTIIKELIFHKLLSMIKVSKQKPRCELETNEDVVVQMVCWPQRGEGFLHTVNSPVYPCQPEPAAENSRSERGRGRGGIYREAKGLASG